MPMSRYIARIEALRVETEKRIKRARLKSRRDKSTREDCLTYQDSVEYWLARGLCQESAEVMAGANWSLFDATCSGPREVYLYEERYVSPMGPVVVWDDD